MVHCMISQCFSLLNKNTWAWVSILNLTLLIPYTYIYMLETTSCLIWGNFPLQFDIQHLYAKLQIGLAGVNPYAAAG